MINKSLLTRRSLKIIFPFRIFFIDNALRRWWNVLKLILKCKRITFAIFCADGIIRISGGLGAGGEGVDGSSQD